MNATSTRELKYLVGPMRAPFLILTPACVFLGVAAAIADAGRVNWIDVLLVLLGAVCAHISVNTLNEYYDFRSGLDFKTPKTPFSGGSGTLPTQPGLARDTLTLGLITLAITALVGVYFLSVRGWALLPLGLLGLVVIFAYTLWLVRNPILSLIAPGTGFGLLMVMGTAFVLTGEFSWRAFFASLVPFFLVNNLLLLNQFPDAEADRTIGRRHFPIVAGIKTSSFIYGAFLLLAYVSIGIGVLVKVLPLPALLGLLTLFLAVPAFQRAFRYGDDLPKLAPAMGMNVLINILTPVLVGVGILIG